jgi:hypothetical protein
LRRSRRRSGHRFAPPRRHVVALMPKCALKARAKVAAEEKP